MASSSVFVSFFYFLGYFFVLGFYFLVPSNLVLFLIIQIIQTKDATHNTPTIDAILIVIGSKLDCIVSSVISENAYSISSNTP